MLDRTVESEKQQRDWFWFSSALFPSLCSDYIALRMLYYLEPLTTAQTILVKMVEVSEKSFKLFVAVSSRSKDALTDSKNNYGHNIEKLRKECARYNTEFESEDIKTFTKSLNDKGGALYQFLRYGSQEMTQGFSADLQKTLPVVDKIFFKTIFLLPEDERRLLNFVSPLKNLLMGSQFDQSQNPELLIRVLNENNNYLDEYIEYCKLLDKKHLEFLANLGLVNKNEAS